MLPLHDLILLLQDSAKLHHHVNIPNYTFTAVNLTPPDFTITTHDGSPQNNTITITIQDPTQQYRHAHVTMEYLTIPLQYTTELNCAQSNRYRIKQDRILLNHYMTAPNHTKLEFTLTYRHVTEIQLATPCHYCIMHYLTLPIQHGSINDVTKPLLNWTKLH